MATLEIFFQDLRYGTRELVRHRGFASVAVLSLALGIMAATSIFSVIHGVILDPFPYRDIDSLTSIMIRNPDQKFGRGSYSVSEYEELSRRATVFEGVVASTISDVLWATGGDPVKLRGNHISNNGFDVMGVPAMLGRVVTTNEEDPETKAVLSHRFWVRQFGSDPSVLGRTLTLNGRPRTIVGVMPPRFMFRGPDVYLPLRYRDGEVLEGVGSVWVTARFKPGVTRSQAKVDLDPILRDLAAKTPNRFSPNWQLDLLSFKETFPAGIRTILWIMFGAVGLLLLIACANVSNLLLARASARESEIAMRIALGAGRMRLFRQLLTENLVLGLGGGALGVLLSWVGLKAILAIIPPNVIPDESDVRLNFPVLMFSLALCLLTTIVSGLAPAMHAATGKLASTIKEAGRGQGGSRRMRWMRGALVIVELSLAVVLLAGAGLFLYTFERVKDAPLAAGIENRLVVRIPLSNERRTTAVARSAFARDALEQVRALPGVRAASINAGLHPLWSFTMEPEIPGSQAIEKREANVHQVDAGYLNTTGIRLISGQWFDDASVAAARHVAVVNQTFAKRWLEGAPLGRTVRLPRMQTAPYNLADYSFEIIGVTQDAIYELQSGEPKAEVYVPYSVGGIANMLVVHTVGDPARLAQTVRRQVYQLDKSEPVEDPRTLQSILERDVYSGGRFRVWLMGVFGVLGLVLAVIGVYGLISQFVALQRREFGIRLAIGASPGEVLYLVVRRGMQLVAIGIVAGTLTALLLVTRFGALLGVADPYHAASFAGAGAVLLAAALAACLIPASRAARTDPAIVLRLE